MLELFLFKTFKELNWHYHTLNTFNLTTSQALIYTKIESSLTTRYLRKNLIYQGLATLNKPMKND